MFDAFALWMLGYPDQAMQRSHEACTLAEGLAHPHTLVYAFGHLVVLHQHRREQEEAHRSVAVATRVSHDQGFPLWLGVSLILQG